MVYSNNGSANQTVGKILSNNGSTNQTVGIVYSNNGSANQLVYKLVVAKSFSNITVNYPGSPPGTSFSCTITSGGLDLRGYNRLAFTFKNDGSAGYWAGGAPTTQQIYGYSNSSYILRGDNSKVSLSNTSYSLDISGWSDTQKSNVRFGAVISGSCSTTYNSCYYGGIKVTNIVAS